MTRPGWYGTGFVLLVFAVPLLVYASTMANSWALDTIYTIDSAEMVIAAHTLGVDHPPGHPLYLIVAHLFSLLPFDPVDGGVILVSAVFTSLACLFLALAMRERTGDTPASVGIAWTLGFAFIFWIHASIPEVYPVQLSFLGLYIYLAARWLKSRGPRLLYAIGLVLGLAAATNVLLVVLLLPSFLFLLLRGGAFLDGDRWAWGRLGALLVCGLIGLTPFLYLPIRIARGGSFISDFVYLSGFDVGSLRWYWWYLTAEEFTAPKVLGASLQNYPSMALAYAKSYAANLSSIAAVFAVAGMIVTAILHRPRTHRNAEQRGRHRRRSASKSSSVVKRIFIGSRLFEPTFDGVLAIAFFCTALPVIPYEVPDREVFYMPSFYFLTGFGVIGLMHIRRLLQIRLSQRHAATMMWLLILASPSYLLATNYPRVRAITLDDSSYAQREERWMALPPRAFIVGEDDGHATRYKYFHYVRGLRPDIAVETLVGRTPRYQGELSFALRGESEDGLRQGLHMVARFKVLKQLLEEAAGRPAFAILDDRMPPEFDFFRTVRSRVDPRLLRIDPKPAPVVSPDGFPMDVTDNRPYYDELRFSGFQMRGLDRGDTRTFEKPLRLGKSEIDGIVKRGEIFELAFAVQKLRDSDSKFFAEFAFVNERLEIPSAHGFSASKQTMILPQEIESGAYRKDTFIFKIPGGIPQGYYMLAARVTKTTGFSSGNYRGRPVQTLRMLETNLQWRGQKEYRPLGRLWIK